MLLQLHSQRGKGSLSKHLLFIRGYNQKEINPESTGKSPPNDAPWTARVMALSSLGLTFKY